MVGQKARIACFQVRGQKNMQHCVIESLNWSLLLLHQSPWVILRLPWWCIFSFVSICNGNLQDWHEKLCYDKTQNCNNKISLLVFVQFLDINVYPSFTGDKSSPHPGYISTRIIRTKKFTVKQLAVWSKSSMDFHALWLFIGYFKYIKSLINSTSLICTK